jgi:hypothetical protein
MIFGRFVSAVGVAVLVASATPACTATANVTEVYTSLDSDGARRRNEFYTDTKDIHCIAEAGIGRDGVTIEGFIRQRQVYDFRQDRFVDVDRVLAYSEAGAQKSEGPFKFSLKLAKRDPSGAELEGAPYPAGRYECEILLDGRREGTAIFNVQFPPCPPAVILQGQTCYGFYKQNDLCPAAGESGDKEPTCSCDEKVGWRCPQ